MRSFLLLAGLVALASGASIDLVIESNDTHWVDPNLVEPKQLIIDIAPADEQVEDDASGDERQLEIEIQDGADSEEEEEDGNSSEEDVERELLMNPNFRNVEPISFDLPTNFSDLIDPNLVVPKMAAAADRATTQCGCGYSVSNPAPAAGRIVGGAVVNPANSLPYQLYFQACFASGCGQCGATLLNKRYALTAMHCVQDNGVLAKSAVVGIGMQSLSDTAGVQKIAVERIITRPDYDSKAITNDIALLRLSQDVVFSSKIVPACLPTNPALTYAGQSSIVSGWGTTSSGGSISQTLKSTTITITAQNDATCTKYASSGSVLPNSKMCAYAASTDSCQGDSGGPLVVKEDGRFTVVGVVSYGNGCATPGYAGVYARVTNYLDWINSNIADGWCSTTNPTPTGPATTTTTTRAPVTTAPTAPRCNLACTNVGTLTATATLNGIASRCDAGQCYALDGSNLCQRLNFPCGGAPATTTQPPSSPICNLQCTNVGLLSGAVTLNGIPSVCMAGFCFSTNGVNLCQTFNNPCGAVGRR